VLGALRGLDAETIELRINSQGGDAIDGLAIYNDLRANVAPKNVIITGIAASAASIIAMAGDHIAMADGASIMIHNAWCTVSGNADFLEKVAGELRGCDDAMARIYTARTGIPDAQVRALMDAETLLTAAEAVDLGFADEVIELNAACKKRKAVTAQRRVNPRAMNSEAGAEGTLGLAAGLRSLAREIRRFPRD
jgi:ATP-dependent Clp protease, protease subunit